MSDSTEEKIRQAIARPMNMGEMADADAVGTVGNPDCGDMLRMWIKFTEKDGKKVIDRASFQSFGCQTAIAVASVATELLRGKSVDEARALGPKRTARQPTTVWTFAATTRRTTASADQTTFFHRVIGILR